MALERIDWPRDDPRWFWLLWRPLPGHQDLTEAEQAVLLAVVFRGPDRAPHGCTDRTLPTLCGWLAARFGRRLHLASLSRIMRRLDLSRQKTRPLHPLTNEKAKAAFVKGGSRAPWSRQLPPIGTSACSRGSKTRSGSG